MRLKRNSRIIWLIKKMLPLLDLCAIPFLFPSAWLMEKVRRVGVRRLPHCRKVLMWMGVFPIRDHYYEPQFKNEGLDFSRERSLPAIDWNEAGQLDLLQKLSFAGELTSLPWDLHPDRGNETVFCMNNGSFRQADAAYWYQMIRLLKPGKIIEIGSGNSTLMARKAIDKNSEEGFRCEHILIEPYEMPWLESLNIPVMRQKVEDVGIEFFSQLEKNDILFIDSSHVIRPDGDVAFEYLELLPLLNCGVVVHVHDICSPRIYKREWLIDDVRFWNEQYLLEAFLSHNQDWEIMGALNYLYHHHFARLKTVAPFLNLDHEPVSFYMRKLR